MVNKKALINIIFFGMAVLWPLSGFSQNNAPLHPTLQAPQYPDVIPYAKLACNNYEEAVKSIYDGARDAKFMGPVRVLYSRCPQYDPFGDDVLREMLVLSEKAKSNDPLEAANTMKEYKNLVRLHLANLAVVQMAWEISREDSRFGDPDFFREVKKMITGSLTEKNQTGTELNRSIKITTFAEQDYIVSKQEGKLEKSEIIEANGVFYNVCDFVAPDNKKRFTLFLDITTPMAVIKARNDELEKKKKLDLNMQ